MQWFPGQEGKRRRSRSFQGRRDRALYLEPLEPQRMLDADFGDAPPSYATLMTAGGAQHEAVGPLLGARLGDSSASIGIGSAEPVG